MQALKELNKLVEELEENCSFTQLGFDAQAIRQHILDILNEQRSVRKGHDYTKVCQFLKINDASALRGRGLGNNGIRVLVLRFKVGCG